jgi:DNA transformation protein and related proteins
VSSSRKFADFIVEQMAGFGPVTARAMFGGFGLYRDRVMFALIADDTLYFKADDTTRREFEAEGLGPFVYGGKAGKNTTMSYWRAPERCLEDPDEMAIWSRKAHAAARSAGQGAKKKR